MKADNKTINNAINQSIQEQTIQQKDELESEAMALKVKSSIDRALGARQEIEGNKTHESGQQDIAKANELKARRKKKKKWYTFKGASSKIDNLLKRGNRKSREGDILERAGKELKRTGKNAQKISRSLEKEGARWIEDALDSPQDYIDWGRDMEKMRKKQARRFRRDIENETDRYLKKDKLLGDTYNKYIKGATET